MPIYEYECRKCGPFEYRQSISDKPLRRCPTCRAGVTKLMSASSFQLKGGGWYSDGYDKKADKKAEKSEKSRASDTKAAEKSGDAKAAPAADSSSNGKGSAAKTGTGAAGKKPTSSKTGTST